MHMDIQTYTDVCICRHPGPVWLQQGRQVSGPILGGPTSIGLWENALVLGKHFGTSLGWPKKFLTKEPYKM